MISLLGKMRKQMNGAVADSMFYYGTNYGLNYGVSLPTVREIAQAEECDHELAQYLFKQQVRELKLAALHIADPMLITTEEEKTWADGITTSELAEEAAFALLPKYPSIKELFASWIGSDNEFAAYAAMMAMARIKDISDKELHTIPSVIEHFPDSRPIAQAAVAMLAAGYMQPALQAIVKSVIASLQPSAAADYISDEMSWRMEF